MVALFGYMELQHEVERIAPQTALVTNHFTGEVRQCHVYRSGDMSCHAVDIEPRSWVFALIPFWPARQFEASTDDMSFTETQLFNDMVTNGIFALIMLVVGIVVMWVANGEEGGSADGAVPPRAANDTPALCIALAERLSRPSTHART